MDPSTLAWLAGRGCPGTSTRRLYAGELARFARFRAARPAAEPIERTLVAYLLDEHRLGRRPGTLRWKRKILTAYFWGENHGPQAVTPAADREIQRGRPAGFVL